MAIAFFDFDQTLIAANSATLWIRRELALGRVSHRQAAQAALWLAQYRVGLSGLEASMGQAIGQARGMRADALAERSRSFFERMVKPLYRPGGLPVVEAHRQRGDRIVMLTSSSHFVGELAVKDLGFDGLLCNRLEIGDDGLLTGKTVGPLCFGEGKVYWARNEAQAHGVGLEACAFYTDSYSDLPVLEVVGQPVAVNPDRRLKRLAQKRGWAIFDWGRPAQ